MNLSEANKGVLCSLLLSIFLLLLCLGISPVHALPADSMWIQPAGIDLSKATVGTKFNATIWLNMSTPANSWQFFLIYNKSHLNATRCDYTGQGKSIWAGTFRTNQLDPSFSSQNATHNYVLHGETLASSANQTGAGSLSWVEFNVTQLPSNRTSTPITEELRLDVSGYFDSLVYDAAFNTIPINFGNCTYIIPEFTPVTLLIALLATTLLVAPVSRPKKPN